MENALLAILRDVPWIVRVAVLAPFVPALVAARAHGGNLRERLLLWLAVLPLVAAGIMVRDTLTILDPPSVPKIDPRFWASLRATEVMMLVGPAVALGALAAAALSPAIRRPALAAVPGALVLGAWSVAIDAHLEEVLMVDPPAKAMLVMRWQPIHAAFVVTTVAVCFVSAWRISGPARVAVTAPLLPLLLWPGWEWVALVSQTTG